MVVNFNVDMVVNVRLALFDKSNGNSLPVAHPHNPVILVAARCRHVVDNPIVVVSCTNRTDELGGIRARGFCASKIGNTKPVYKTYPPS
jgi:hypothetical protein